MFVAQVSGEEKRREKHKIGACGIRAVMIDPQSCTEKQIPTLSLNMNVNEEPYVALSPVFTSCSAMHGTAAVIWSEGMRRKFPSLNYTKLCPHKLY